MYKSIEYSDTYSKHLEVYGNTKEMNKLIIMIIIIILIIITMIIIIMILIIIIVIIIIKFW